MTAVVVDWLSYTQAMGGLVTVVLVGGALVERKPIDVRGLLRLRDAAGKGSRKRQQRRQGKWPQAHV